MCTREHLGVLLIPICVLISLAPVFKESRYEVSSGRSPVLLHVFFAKVLKELQTSTVLFIDTDKLSTYGSIPKIIFARYCFSGIYRFLGYNVLNKSLAPRPDQRTI